MALLKLGAIVTGISGKVGGQTIGIGPAGQYLKNTGSYINKASSRRKAVNQALVNVTNKWRSLSEANKLSWAALSPSLPYTNRIGDTAYYSGFNLFTQFNYNLNLVNKGPIDTAPAISTNSPPGDCGILLGAGDVKVFTAGGDTDVIGKVFVSAGRSKGTEQYASTLRYLGAWTQPELSGGEIVTSQFEEAFGPYVVGMMYFVRIYFFDSITGQPLGTWISKKSIAT